LLDEEYKTHRMSERDKDIKKSKSQQFLKNKNYLFLKNILKND